MEPPSTESSTLSLHDALPILQISDWDCTVEPDGAIRLGLRYVNGLRQEIGKRIATCRAALSGSLRDRKSTRLSSSHRCISYAVFCLKKKNISKGGDRTTAIPT